MATIKTMLVRVIQRIKVFHFVAEFTSKNQIEAALTQRCYCFLATLSNNFTIIFMFQIIF